MAPSGTGREWTSVSERREPGHERTRREGQSAGLGGEQVEGRRAVRELLRSGRRRVRSVWLAEGRDDSTLLDDIERLAATKGIRVRRVDRSRLAAEARTDAPQGVLARAEPVEPADFDALLDDPAAFLVALDGVTDPGNLGAILRVAGAAGATGVVLPRHRSALLTPAAVKAAAGAVEQVPIALVSGVPAALDRARRGGVWTVGLDAAGSRSVFEIPVADQPLLLVLGAEGRGLGRLTRDRCDVLAAIPMPGTVDSLNVATAAAIACFEIVRRRQDA
jgi:23S rRNA (guanosine2251-2'-O)-methyltransferase